MGVDVIARNARTCDAPTDRVGLGWRGELAAGIFTHLDKIDLIEIIADDHFRATPRDLRAIATLAAQTPITWHGVAMGLAGSEATDTKRIDSMARLVDVLQPESWSEHLAFVRAGGIEIGHLAAPPRTPKNVDAAIANIRRAGQIVGRLGVHDHASSPRTKVKNSTLVAAALPARVVFAAFASAARTPRTVI